MKGLICKSLMLTSAIAIFGVVGSLELGRIGITEAAIVIGLCFAVILGGMKRIEAVRD